MKENTLYNSCSFTGHRLIEDRHREKISDLVLRGINYAYGKGCREFLTGGALGFDTLAAKEVIRFRMTHPDVRLRLILPCRNQTERWNERDVRVYEYVLASANSVEYVADEYTDGCMRERNRRLAERADILIAYLGRERSGAGQTARLARSLGKEVYNLYTALDNGN